MEAVSRFGSAKLAGGWHAEWRLAGRRQTGTLRVSITETKLRS
jgi:hypothetical protein